MSSIPGHRPGPILNGPRKAFLAAFFIIPAGLYAFLRVRQSEGKQQRRLLEEEGRRNWIQAERERAKGVEEKDLSVRVGRSGGGV